jgi:hypothetical protein
MFAQMLASISALGNTPVKPKTKRNTAKAIAARKEKVRKWFQDNLKNDAWSTSQIAAKRGQTNASCLPLLYDLENAGFIQRAGHGERIGRGKRPVFWKLVKPVEEIAQY